MHAEGVHGPHHAEANGLVVPARRRVEAQHVEAELLLQGRQPRTAIEDVAAEAEVVALGHLGQRRDQIGRIGVGEPRARPAGRAKARQVALRRVQQQVDPLAPAHPHVGGQRDVRVDAPEDAQRAQPAEVRDPASVVVLHQQHRVGVAGDLLDGPRERVVAAAPHDAVHAEPLERALQAQRLAELTVGFVAAALLDEDEAGVQTLNPRGTA